MKTYVIESILVVLNFVLVYEGAKTLLSQAITKLASFRTIAKSDINEILINLENRLYEVEKKL